MSSPQLRSQPPTLSLPPEWKQGEHMAIIGQTGTGKSTLASRLLRLRTWVLICQSQADPGVRYRPDCSSKSYKVLDDVRQRRVLLRPVYEEQAEQFYLALKRVWEHGGWTVYIDESLAFQEMGLEAMVKKLLTQGRKEGITVVSGMQRPVGVTRYALTQSRHILSFQLEGKDARELADSTSPRVRDVVEGLPNHAFVWFKKPGELWNGRLNLRTNQFDAIA